MNQGRVMVYSHSILDELIAVWQRDLSDMDRQIALYFDQSAWIILIACIINSDQYSLEEAGGREAGGRG